MDIKESGQMYLESIYFLSQKQPYVRAIDVARFMDYSKPSVSRAIKVLRERGYLEITTDDHLLLTDKGKAVAREIAERHVFLSQLLISLGVPEAIAVKDACRIEHYISPETLAGLKKIAVSKK